MVCELYAPVVFSTFLAMVRVMLVQKTYILLILVQQIHQTNTYFLKQRWKVVITQHYSYILKKVIIILFTPPGLRGLMDQRYKLMRRKARILLFHHQHHYQDLLIMVVEQNYG